mmetsp:Transcript_19382/g.26657  ORF Transcript_19382/g.26657 Transcript_19382/m.26657 type:complete len:96 (+) Transcript_19382:529-816(+)
MCDELGDETYMEEYVLEASGISLCSASTGAGCSERETTFAQSWRAKDQTQIASQLARLQSVSKQSGSTKPELQKWLKQRVAILKQLVAAEQQQEL